MSPQTVQNRRNKRLQTSFHKNNRARLRARLFLLLSPYARLAQLVERPPDTRQVLGSNPRARTTSLHKNGATQCTALIYSLYPERTREIVRDGYTVYMEKKLLIGGGVAIVAIGVGIAAFFYGGGAAPQAIGQQPAVNVPFAELAKDAHSTVITRVNYLITSESEFIKLWKMVDAAGAPPKVDFSTKYVAAVFAGKKPTGGYGITVSKVEDANVRMVTITLAKPDAACILTQAETAPYQIIELPKTTLSFSHEDQTSTVGCTD